MGNTEPDSDGMGQYDSENEKADQYLKQAVKPFQAEPISLPIARLRQMPRLRDSGNDMHPRLQRQPDSACNQNAPKDPACVHSRCPPCCFLTAKKAAQANAAMAAQNAPGMNIGNKPNTSADLPFGARTRQNTKIVYTALPKDDAAT